MPNCKFCGKEFGRGTKFHERYCKENPNRESGSNQHTKAKETGIPYEVSDETKEKISKASTGRKHTKETKKKISEKRIK